ncbi:hypothetical protein OHB26_17290 [Nocardia sp. NBC_01503]|uniref:hypothetical protein n=1 Tax=Nocardia sp. NBC_01503 TaxID=2975997 RepID=UPI002E7B61C5|nr:hypothetical protein [Nocardia sp. NBC_01503]WTL35796.1 hypothetical protein OHB26_17290 [Nocardia sp. NBC_01503]
MTAAVGARPGDSPRAASVPAPNWVTIAIALFLTVDALITLVLEVFYLPIYAGHAHVPTSQPVLAAAAPLASTATTAGAIALPITALVAGVVNVLLVMGMSVVSQRIPVMIIPLTVWTLGFLVCASSGPGGDALLISDWPTMALLLCGLVPAGLYLYWRATARYAHEIKAVR